MFKVTKVSCLGDTIRHGVAAIQLRTVITVITPATVAYSDLAAWIKSRAVYNESCVEWDLLDDEIGGFNSPSGDIVDLILDVQERLQDYGVVVMDERTLTMDA